MTKLYTSEVPLVSKEFAVTLAQIFRPIVITPETTMQEIQFNAGQQKVVQFVLNHTATRQISGDPEVLVRPEPSKLNYIQVLYSKVRKLFR